MFSPFHRSPDPPPAAVPARRATDACAPTVALALGSGAARGFAHIGVLRVLEQNGIRPCVVTGTSMGAVVGGLWAAGKLDELEAWALGLTKRSVLSMLDFVLGGPGLLGGRRLMELMRQQLGDTIIEDLPVTFAAIATEFGFGHEIWLTRGNVVEAVRASYALPGIFTPVKIGGRWLMDGALVNPIPVSAARALGGRLVIAVNLNGDAFGRGTVIQDHGDMLEEVGSAAEKGLAARLAPARRRRHFIPAPAPEGPRAISTVMVDAFNIIQDRIARSRLAGDPPDIALVPKLGHIGLFDFHRAQDAIAIGAEATEKALDDIHAAMEVLR